MQLKISISPIIHQNNFVKHITILCFLKYFKMYTLLRLTECSWHCRLLNFSNMLLFCRRQFSTIPTVIIMQTFQTTFFCVFIFISCENAIVRFRNSNEAALVTNRVRVRKTSTVFLEYFLLICGPNSIWNILKSKKNFEY